MTTQGTTEAWFRWRNACQYDARKRGRTRGKRVRPQNRNEVTPMLGQTTIDDIPASRRILTGPGATCGRCGRRHQTWLVAAKCTWPRAVWVMGENPLSRGPCFALVSFCRAGAPTVTLWADFAAATISKAAIDRLACGGCCRKAHVIYELTGGENPT